MIAIPEHEVEFLFSRSGGPGGQNVNRRETRVQLRFSVLRSSVLNDEQKTQILNHTAVRHLLDTDGAILLAASTHRSQRMNMEDAVARLHQLLHRALAPRKKRLPTKVSKASKRRRLEAKKRRSATKTARQTNRSRHRDE